MFSPCKLSFDYQTLNFQIFRPSRNQHIESPGRYNYYGCYEKGQFKHFSDNPTEFIDQYEDFVCSNPQAISCVSADLRSAEYHQIVLDFDCRDSVRQQVCEQKSVAFLGELFANSDMSEDLEIYCFAKEGGQARGRGLHVIVPGVSVASLDYYAMVVYLKRYIPELDSQITNWCLPFASKGPDPRDVYYPYGVFQCLPNPAGGGGDAVSRIRIFTRAGLLQKFLNVLGPADPVYHFRYGVYGAEEIAFTEEPIVPVLQSSVGSNRFLSKNCNALRIWSKEEERSIFQDFCTPNSVPCEEFSSFRWSSLLPRQQQAEVGVEIAEFSVAMKPLTIEDVCHYASQPNAADKVCQALAMSYTKEVGAIIADGLDIGPDLFEKVYQQYNYCAKNLRRRAALQALKVDIYAVSEFSDAGADDLNNRRIWMTWEDIRFLPAIAVRQLENGEATVKEIAPYLLPAMIHDEKGCMYFDQQQWHVLKSKTNLKECEHLIIAKLQCLADCSTYLLQKKQSASSQDSDQGEKNKKNRKQKTGKDITYRELLSFSMQFWIRYQTCDVPRCTFAFENGQIWDFRLEMLHYPLMCFHDTQRSELTARVFNCEAERRVYFSQPAESEAALSDWPEISEFLLAVFGNETETIDYFVDIVTDIVSWKKQKSFYFFLGEKANNAKTTLLSILDILFGKMSAYIQHNTLRRGFRETNPDLCAAALARVMVLDEVNSSSKIDSTLLKAITGNSRIYVRNLFKSGTSQPFAGTLILSANGLPMIEMTRAIIHRFKPVHFKMVFLPQSEIDLLERTTPDPAKRASLLENCRPSKDFTNTEMTLLAEQLLEICAGRLHLENLGQRPEVPVPPHLVQLKNELVANLDDLHHCLQVMGFEITRDQMDRVTKDQMRAGVKSLSVKQKDRHIDMREFLQRVECICLRADSKFFYGIRHIPDDELSAAQR